MPQQGPLTPLPIGSFPSLKPGNKGRYISKAVYTLLVLNMEGKKILSLHLSEDERTNYWLSVLTDLHNRGVEDILIACVDGLKGFPGAIASIFPQTEVQLSVPQLNEVVASKALKAFIAGLKPVYRAVQPK